MYYQQIMHPLAGGAFRAIGEVEDAIRGIGGKMQALEVGEENWRLVETVKKRLQASTFARPELASQFQELPGEPGRWAFSYGIEDVLFSGVLVLDAATGRWDGDSPLVISDRIRETFGTAPELIPLAAHLVENTRGSVNDQT